MLRHKRKVLCRTFAGIVVDREAGGRNSGQTPCRNAAGALTGREIIVRKDRQSFPGITTGRGNFSGKAAQSLWPLLPNRSSG